MEELPGGDREAAAELLEDPAAPVLGAGEEVAAAAVAPGVIQPPLKRRVQAGVPPPGHLVLPAVEILVAHKVLTPVVLVELLELLLVLLIEGLDVLIGGLPGTLAGSPPRSELPEEEPDEVLGVLPVHLLPLSGALVPAVLLELTPDLLEVVEHLLALAGALLILLSNY